MAIEDDLRRIGEALTAAAPDDVRERVRVATTTRPTRRRTLIRRHLWRPVAGALVGSAAIAGAVVAVISRDPPPPPSPSHAATSPVATTTAAACTAVQLTPSYDAARSGPTAGVEQVVLLFRNVGAAPCWLGGLPTLSGVTSQGRVVRLRFSASRDPAIADPSPAAGPGMIPVDGVGALHLTLQLNGCTRPGVRYLELRVTLVAGEVVVLRDVPSQLSLSGCLGNESEAGPVVVPSQSDR